VAGSGADSGDAIAEGFYYEQISGDSGSDALLGDFEGRTLGVGPVVSYVRQIGSHSAPG
jgi:hypothetical protein